MRQPRIPKRPENPGPDQGELVRFDIVPDGNTEPSQAGRARVENIEFVQDGLLPPADPEISVEPTSSEWDGENYKDGFHFDPLTDDEVRRNVAGARAARAAIHGAKGLPKSTTTTAIPETQQPGKPEAPTREDLTKKKMAISRLLATIVMSYEQPGAVISELALKAAEPSNLAKHLFGSSVIVSDRTKGIGKQAAMYKKPDGKWQAVALSAQERKIFKNNVQAYADAPYITAKAGKTYNPEHDPSAPTRAVYHALDESIIPKMETYVETLRTREQILRQFNEALAPGRYGLARMGSEAAMRGNASILFDQILPDALDAIGDQKQWTAEKAK